MSGMTDMDKVIKGLQIERECVSRDCDRNCGQCDLVQDRDWLLSVYDDALTLLKDRETNPVEPIEEIVNNVLLWHCGKCGFYLGPNDHFCSNCGRSVKWE